MEGIVLDRHVTPEDQAENPYPLLAFEVPPGVSRLHISYEVSDSIPADKAGWGEGNIVDIGLFDPRGAEFPTGSGFRGWSGTSLQAFSIGANEASPGYLRGAIQPGTWHVVLGLYQLIPDGCDVRIMIRLEPGEDDRPFPLPCQFDTAPIAGGPRWFRGDLHAHSHHSDGSALLADLVAAAKAQELDFIAVTEHNTVSHLPRLMDIASPDLLLIPGMEISTYHGHANVFPLIGWVDFRCWRADQMAVVRDVAREQGLLFSVNHPKDGGPPWAFESLFDPDCIEVWGAPWFISNYQALAVWDRLLREGHRVTAVGGSDKHQGPFTGELGWYELGTPTTWVWAESLSIPTIIAGLRAGRVFISEGPDGPRIDLTVETDGRRAVMGETLPVTDGASLRLACRVEGGAGSLLRLVSDRQALEVNIPGDLFGYEWVIVPQGDGYFRPEVIEPPEAPLDEEPAALMARALGNPVYLEHG
jgi:hypothetical protein